MSLRAAIWHGVELCVHKGHVSGLRVVFVFLAYCDRTQPTEHGILSKYSRGN